MIFLFLGVGVSLCPLDRETHWRIEMLFMKRPVYSIELYCVTIGSLELKIWLESRSRIVFLFFCIGVPHCPLDREPHWEIEMPFVKRPVHNVHRIFSVTRAQILVGIRTRMLYFFFKTWCAALSSRSREPSRDRGVTHEAIYNERNIW